ncbi:MAG: Uma2 family endonuclease [Myxococcota bacterium]
MSSVARHHTFTLDDYFAVEARGVDKHELWDGQILLMAGGSARHNALCANFLGVCVPALRGGACRALSADQRITTPDGLYTYADATLVCGPLDLGREQTLRNPTVLVEVLSDATRAYDRAEKLHRYQQIPSLRHVLLIEQARVDVEHWYREATGWARTVVTDPDGALRLEPPGLTVPLAELYDGVFDLAP